MTEPDEHISDEEAATLLGVTVEQLDVMVDDGLLVEVEHETWGRSFSRAEVQAARNLGG